MFWFGEYAMIRFKDAEPPKAKSETKAAGKAANAAPPDDATIPEPKPGMAKAAKAKRNKTGRG
jgi:hypothetical protein